MRYADVEAMSLQAFPRWLAAPRALPDLPKVL
jgi:hypothetical protein